MLPLYYLSVLPDLQPFGADGGVGMFFSYLFSIMKPVMPFLMIVLAVATATYFLKIVRQSFDFSEMFNRKKSDDYDD